MESSLEQEIQRLLILLRKKVKDDNKMVASDIKEVEYLVGLVWEAQKCSKTKKQLDKLASLVQEIVPLLRYFDENDPNGIANELCNGDYEFRRRICNHVAVTIHWAIKIGLTLNNASKSEEARELLQCCYQQATSGVFVFCKAFGFKDDDQLKNEIQKLVILAYIASMLLLSQHTATGMKKILKDHLTWWSNAHKICGKIEPPTQLVKVWVEAQCRDGINPEASDRTIYELLSSCPSFGNAELCILAELEHQEYKKTDIQYRDLSEQMLRILEKILAVDLQSTRHTLRYCSRLFVEARSFRSRGAEFLSECKDNLSEVISTMTALHKRISSELHVESKEEIYVELAKAHSMRALCTQETDPHSKSLMEDIEEAVNFWCLEHTCTTNDLGLLYSVFDLLAVKGNTRFHSRIYEKLLHCAKLKNGDLKDLCINLWKSRRLSHDICGSPICGDFLTRLSNRDNSWSHVDSWTQNMEEIHAVGFKHKLAIDTNIQRMKKLAYDLIQNDASDHNQFLVAHIYYDLAETLTANGSMIEAKFFANEAYQLRAQLLKKMFIIPEDMRLFRSKQLNETLKVRREVTSEVGPHDDGLNDFEIPIITPWNILQIYLESGLQCGYLEENVHEASDYLVSGKNISLIHNLEIFKIRFAEALANHHTRKQSEGDLAKEELIFAAKELNVNNHLISCWKCKDFLEVCMKRESGDAHRKESKTAASFYDECVKILKDSHWENSFSAPMVVGPKNATFCHSCGISEPISQSQKYEEECWHCQSIKILKSGSLETATYFKIEIIRRHLLMGLLASMGEYHRAQNAYVEEQKVLYERVSLFLSRSTFNNQGIEVSEKFIESIIDQRLTGFPFITDYAALTYDICCYFLRSTSEFTISKQQMVRGMKNSFTLSRQIPEHHKKISRLLSVLYYDDMQSTGGKGLSDLRNGLNPHPWIAYLHQSSIGTLLNNTFWTRMKKKAGLDIKKDDLPGVPLVCMSLIGEDANLLRKLLSPSPTQAWLQLSRLCQNEEPQVYILPITFSITDVPSSFEPGYTLSTTEGENVVDQVAPIYSSIMRMRERVSNNEIKEVFGRWERILDSCLSEVLSRMEEWFSNHKEAILGNSIEGKQGKGPHRTPIILILDSEIQCVTWESMPFLRSEDIYRMPSVISVASTLQSSSCFIKEDGRFPVIDLSKTYYVLNPDGYLQATQDKLLRVFNRHQFKGIAKSFPSQHKFIEALGKNDMFIFDGHDSALDDVSTSQIRNMDRCPAALLTACTSGAIELQGCYEPAGPVLHYILAGSPTIASYLWVANALETDTMSNHIIKTLTRRNGPRTMGKAVALARKECSLRFYEGAGLICYGVPTRFIKTANR